MNDDLQEIAETYRDERPEEADLHDALRRLYRKYVRQREESILDAAASAAAIGPLVSDRVNFDAITPQMEEAWSLTYPGVELAALDGAPPEAVQGYVNAWKGKYFEVLVRDRLNAGETVGSLQLGPGQYAELVEDISQPGWDLAIRNADGSTVEHLQLKATEELSYVREALERYPEIDVIAADEAAGTVDQVLESGISDDTLSEEILSPMEALLDSPLEELTESVLPYLPFVVITVSEGRHVMMGKSSFDRAVANVTARAVKSGTAILAGSLVVMLEGGLLALPSAFLVRLGVDRVQVTSRIKRQIIHETARTAELIPVYAEA